MADGFQDVLDPGAKLLVILPGVAIFLAISAFNGVGDGIREAIGRGYGAVFPSVLSTSERNRGLSPTPAPTGSVPPPAT